MHGVEQTPPNSRKKTLTGVSTGKKLTGYAPNATGKCSTCSQTFANAQDFYEHFDDCGLRIVQQEDPAEAINARRLAEVENDRSVHQTLEKNNLPMMTQTGSAEGGDDDDEEDDMADDDEADDASSRANSSPSLRKNANPANGVQKSRRHPLARRRPTGDQGARPKVPPRLPVVVGLRQGPDDDEAHHGRL